MRTPLTAFLLGCLGLAAAAWPARAASAPAAIDLAARMRQVLDMPNSIAEVDMTLTSRSGEIRRRQLRILRKIDPRHGLARTLVRIVAPEELRGTGLLILDQARRRTDAYLYIPALRRIRHLEPAQKGAPFMGSDLAYQDWERRPVEADQHRLLGIEERDGARCQLLETIVDDRAARFSRIVWWVQTGTAVPVYGQFFDRDGVLAQEFTADRIGQRDGRWLVLASTTRSLAAGTMTRLETTEISFVPELSDQLFTRRSLEDIR